MKLIECVPNFSEGRDLAAIAAIRDAIAAVPNVSILHVTSDASHNRSVITFVAPAETIVDAAFAGIQMAQARIDLTQHLGVHPRMGAADVVPLIPLDGATMDDCIALARELGERVGRDLDIPVYLYERAAKHSARSNLANVRRGGFDAIAAEIESNPDRAPDYGPKKIHPTAGAVAIGARPFLIAYNVYLGGTENLETAKAVARAVRGSSGGLPALKALGLEVDGQAQVSMNLVDIEQTTLITAHNAVESEARKRGVEVTWSEIIGLVPETALFEVAEHTLRLRDSIESHVLERRLLETKTAIRSQQQEHSLNSFLTAIESDASPFGGGSVAAYGGALSAALIKMVADLSTTTQQHNKISQESKRHLLDAADAGSRIASDLADLSGRDAAAFALVLEAYRMPKTTDLEIAQREDRVQESLLLATEVPLEVAELCAACATHLLTVAKHGLRAALSDVGVAALFAEAACRGAVYNVQINVQALTSDHSELLNRAIALAEQTKRIVAETTAIVEVALSSN